MSHPNNKLVAGTAGLLTLLCSTAWCQSPAFIEGFSHPYRSAEVAASTTGIIEQWLVNEGDTVTTGQPLVKLDGKVHRALIDIAEAAVESQGELALAKAEQILRKQRLDAIEELTGKGHATPDELNRAQSEWEVAAARVLAAKENQLRRELELNKLKVQSHAFTVVAPFHGVVTKTNRLAGEYVGPLQPVVCEIAELDHLSVRFLAPSEAIESLSNGGQVDVKFLASGNQETGVATVSPYPDAETGMRSIHVKIANPDGGLPAGVRCRLILQSITDNDSLSNKSEAPASEK